MKKTFTIILLLNCYYNSFAATSPPTGSSSQIFCSGAKVSNLIAIGTLIKWYDAPTNGNLLSPTATLVNNTPYYATQTVNGVESTTRLAVTATVNALPSVLLSSNAPICAGNALNLSNSGGSSYIWRGPNAFSSTTQNPQITNAPIAASGTYTLTVSNVSACTATATIGITINANPTASAGNNSPICSGNTLNLTSSSSANSYLWRGPNAFSSTSQNVNLNNANSSLSGTYTLTIINENACTATATTAVIINDLPISSASSNSPVCVNNSLILGNNGTVNSPVAAYLWTGPNAFSSTVQSPQITNVATSTTGVYTLTVSNNGCSAISTTTVIINVNPSMPTNFSVNNTTICSGVNISLSATCASGVVNWYTSATVGVAIGTGAIFSHSPVETTTYYASCKNNLCESSRAMASTVTVLADLTVGARIPQINLAGTLSINNPTYWRPLAFAQGALCALSSVGTAVHYTTQTFTLATPSNVSVSLLTSDGATLSPNADTFISLYSSFNPSAVCTNIIAANDDADASNASRITTTNPLPAGSYTIVITSVKNTPTNTNDAVLPWNFTTIVQASSIGVASAPSNLRVNGGVNPINTCSAENVALTGTCANGTIKWYTSLTSTVAAGSGSPLNIVTSTSTTYYASCENICSVSARVATQEITVKPSPNAPTNVSVSNETVCFGTSITLSASCEAIATSSRDFSESQKELVKAGLLNSSNIISSASTLLWYNQATGGTAIGSGTNFMVTPTANTTYYAVCQNDCGLSQRVGKAVVVTSIPVTPITTNKNICFGTSASLSATCISGDIVWYATNSAISGTANSPFITPILIANTDYFVSCESGGAVNCVSERVKVSVNIIALPTPTTSSNSPVCVGKPLNISATGGVSYAWIGPNLFTSNNQNLNFSNATSSLSGIYNVTATNSNGCSASTSVVVLVKEVIVTATNNGPYTVGQTIEILATGGEYYSWTGPNNFTSNLASPTIPNILSANAGIYNVTVTQNGCSTTATTNVIVNGIDPCVRLVDYLYVKAGNPYQPLFLLKDGMEISEISGQVSILVNPVCLNTVIKSFEMNIQGPNLNWNIWQNVYFYALFDNVGLNVFGRNFIPGNYTLTTTGYSLENKGGTKTYGPVITRFSVVANPATISQVTTSKNSICAGNNLDVSFTTSGTFDAKNLFKIELSDVNGSFENPLIIGTSSTAEKVSCLIPLSTIASDKYLIRVVSSNQVLAGNPSTNTFTVNPLLINLTSPNNDFSTGDNTKKAVTIMASNKVISLAKVNFQGGKAIVLNAGFEAKNGTVFKAEIGGCEN